MVHEAVSKLRCEGCQNWLKRWGIWYFSVVQLVMWCIVWHGPSYRYPRSFTEAAWFENWTKWFVDQWSKTQRLGAWRFQNQHLRHKTMQRVQYQSKKPLKVAQYPYRRPRRQIGSATMLLRKSKESTLEVKYLIDKWLGWIGNRHRLRFR